MRLLLLHLIVALYQFGRLRLDLNKLAVSCKPATLRHSTLHYFAGNTIIIALELRLSIVTDKSEEFMTGLINTLTD
ncbi:hypothetical protein T09_8450 [Trichinella sp. T9]|nr:hypothetical protein T09_8450 [Trichinella sp. T9]